MRIYRVLLYLYPASFRSEYGDEMCHVFAERRRMASSPIAVAGLWLETVLEILSNAARIHWDIGVRIALGAQSKDILRIVVREAVLLASIGCALGLVLGYVSGRSVEALLAGVPPADMPTFAAAMILAFVMTVSGSLLPALRPFA